MSIRSENSPRKEGLLTLFSRGSVRLTLPCIGLAASFLLWWFALPSLAPQTMQEFGLLDVLPQIFYISLGLLVPSFCAALFEKRLIRWVLFAHIALFILIVHGTPALTYDNLRYSWAWKHVGIIDYIIRYGTVDRSIQEMAAYHNWPGFFSANAVFVKAAGLTNALPFASWAPVFFNLLNVIALHFLLSSLLTDERWVWATLWIFSLTSWVGQDYFSPQAFVLFLHLMALGIVARWFRRIPTLPLVGTPNVRIFVEKQPKLFTINLLLFLTCLFFVIASSHQLTPLVTTLSLVILAITARSRAILGLAALMSVLTMTWIVFGAAPYFGEVVEEFISSFGKISANAESTVYQLTDFSRPQRIVALAGRVLTLSVWLSAFFAMVKQFFCQRFQLRWDLVFLAGAPFVFLVAGSYGGEILFRVYLFSLPFMSIWVASLFSFNRFASQRWDQLLHLTCLSWFLLASFLVAYYGKEQNFYFSPSEVEAAELMYDLALPGALIVEGTRNYPSRYKNYEQYTHVAIAYEPAQSRNALLRKPRATLRSWMSNTAYSDAYIIITKSQKAEIDAVRGKPLELGDLDRVEKALLGTPDFEVIYKSDDATVLRYDAKLDVTP